MKTVAAILGITAVILGALGAHALKADLLSRTMTETWATAIQYHLVHAVAVLAIALVSGGGDARQSKVLRTVGACWSAGTLLFSGSLYVLALGGPRWLGPITPLGGVLLIAGWAGLILLKRRAT